MARPLVPDTTACVDAIRRSDEWFFALVQQQRVWLSAAVATLTFTQAAAVTRALRTVDVPVAAEGRHTLVVRATDWTNATQATLVPVTFTFDRQAPTVTIDARARTVADIWQPESGVLRFSGTASDGVGLAAVQIREGAQPFVDAIFGNGVWRTALPVRDPEGRTLSVVVRAIDRAGRDRGAARSKCARAG